MSDESQTRLPVGLIVGAMLLLVLLPFLPLIFAGIEEATLGSRRVEGFFEAIGLHDELGTLYDFVLRPFR